MTTTTPVPDLVQISKLDTQFYTNPDYTQHTIYVSGRTTKERGTRKEEKWKRERRLGRGAFGVVWLERCIQGDSKGEVRAVKKVPKFENSNCHRELEAINLFTQTKFEEFFVKSFGWYDDDDSIFIAMEYLPDGDLHKHLNSPLSETEGQRIVSQILEGLRFMHELGFTHRDLKPANILIASKGPDWWVKIADFGISKRATEGLTALRTVTGTPAFTAPEVLPYFRMDDTLNDSYTNAVDVWSLGVIAFLILTGESLFTDPSRLGQYITGNFTFPSNTLLANKPKDRPHVKECLQHPWLHCLIKTPETQRKVILPESLRKSQDYSDSEPSASWSTQNQISAHKTHRSNTVSAERVAPTTTKVGALTSEQATQNNWKIQRTLKGHSDYIRAVAFSPDGKQIASASADNTIRLWDSATGAARNVLRHPRGLFAVAFSPDGNQIVSGGGTQAVLWDSATGASNRIIAQFTDVYNVAFSPDGKQIAVSDGGEISLWDSITGAALDTFHTDMDIIVAIAFSPDGKQIAAASIDTTVLLNSFTGTVRHTLRGHSNRIMAVAFSPDGKQIASASMDTMVRLWSSVTGIARDVSLGHSDWVWDVVFSPDGEQIASAVNSEVRLWDSATGVLRKVLKMTSVSARFVAFSPDGKQIASGSGNQLVLWGLGPGMEAPTKERRTLAKYL